MRILVVDDEPDLCHLLQKYLRRQGYEIEAAGSGEEAWETVQCHPGTFDAFIVDLALPGMSGLDLARKLISAQPSARILFTSGYAFDSVPIDSEKGSVAFLMKPFMPKQLVDALKGLIG